MSRVILPFITSPLAPSGGSPGFDSGHVAANGCVLSVVSTGVGAINILKPSTAVYLPNSPTARVDGNLGIGGAWAGASGSGYVFLGSIPAVANNTFTTACLFRPLDLSDYYVHLSDAGGAAGWWIGSTNAGEMFIASAFNANITSGVFLTVGVPYFLAVSVNRTAANTFNVNFLARRLDAGQIQSSTVIGGSTTDPSASDGNIIVGGNSFIKDCFGVMAASMFNNKIALSPPQLLQWAQDPFAFWKPRTLDLSLIMASATGASPTGTLAATESPDTAAFTSTYSVQGVLGATEAADVAAFAVNVVYSGALAATEAPDVAAFAAAFSVQGTLAATEAPDVAAFTSTYLVQGTLAATEAPDVAAFTSAYSVTGTLGATEAADVAAFAVNVVYSGALAATEAPDTAAFTSNYSVQGALVATEAPDVAAFTATYNVTGALAATEAPDVAAFVSTYSVQGVLGTTESPDVAAFTGTVGDDYFLTLAATEAPDVAAFASAYSAQGVLTATESPDVAAFTGNVVYSGTLAATESPDVAAFTATFAVQGAMIATEAPDVAAFAANYNVQGALVATEAPDVAAFTANFVGLASGVLAATEAPDIAAFVFSEPSFSTDGQTVLSNHGPAGRYVSRKKWLEVLDEMRREREAVARPVKKPNKVAAKAVRNAERIAADVVEIADAADALRLARMVEDARSESATLKAFQNADLAIAKANEAIVFARMLQKAIEDEQDDEDEVLMMLFAA